MPAIVGTSEPIFNFAPTQIGGCALWLDAGDPSNNGTVPAVDSAISVWNDKSGNGRNLTAYGTVTYSTYGGISSIRFNNTYMRHFGAVDLRQYTVFAVSRCQSARSNQNGLLAIPLTGYEYDSTDGFGMFIDSDSGYQRDRFHGGLSTNNVLNSNPSGTDAYPLRMMCWTQTSTSSLSSWYNGNIGNTNSSGTVRTSTATGFGIGFDILGQNGTVGNTTCLSQFSEFLVYTQVLTTSQRQQIEGYLAWKWNIRSVPPSPTAYRYYQFKLDELIGGAGFAQYSEFRLYNGSTMVSLAGGTATATPDSTNGGEGPAQAIDNNITTKVGNNFPLFTLTITLPAPVTATSFAYVTANDNSFRDPSKWVVRGSTDGITYVDLHIQFTTYQPPTDRFTETARFLFDAFALPGSHSYRSLRPFARAFNLLTDGPSGLALWLDGADGNTVSNPVTNWTDKSGYGRTATSAGSSIPWTSSTGLQFSGAQYLTVNGLAGALVNTAFTIFFVETYGGTNAAYLFGDLTTNGSTSQNLHIGYRSSGQFTFALWSDDLEDTTISGSGVRRVTAVNLPATANRNIRRNGAVSVTGNTTKLGSFRNPVIGQVFGGNYYSGFIQEIIVYVGDLTIPQLQQLEGYLSWKWGLSGSLPTTHLHYQLPPFSVPFGPLTIPGCVLWSDATQISASNGSAVGSWVNRGSGGTVNCTGIYTTNAGPTGAMSVVTFATTQTWIPETAVNLSAYSLFFVMRQNGGTNSRVLQSTTNNQLYGYWGGFKKQLYTDNNPNTLGGTASDTAWDIMSHTRVAGGAYTFNWNGTSLYTGSSSTTNNMTGLAINSGASPAETSTCQVAEILLYNSVLSAKRVSLLEGYLAEKWGLKQTLPSTHPYYKPPASCEFEDAVVSQYAGQGVYVRFYNATSSSPSTTIGGSGWGSAIGTAGAYSIISFVDQYNSGSFRLPQDDSCIVYAKGYYYSATADTVQFQTNTDDGIQIYLNNTLVLNNWTLHGPTIDTSAAISVSAGYTPFYLIFFEWGGGAVVTMNWKTSTSGYNSSLTGSFFYDTANP